MRSLLIALAIILIAASSASAQSEPIPAPPPAYGNQSAPQQPTPPPVQNDPNAIPPAPGTQLGPQPGYQQQYYAPRPTYSPQLTPPSMGSRVMREVLMGFAGAGAGSLFAMLSVVFAASADPDVGVVEDVFTWSAAFFVPVCIALGVTLGGVMRGGNGMFFAALGGSALAVTIAAFALLANDTALTDLAPEEAIGFSFLTFIGAIGLSILGFELTHEDEITGEDTAVLTVAPTLAPVRGGATLGLAGMF